MNMLRVKDHINCIRLRHPVHILDLVTIYFLKEVSPRLLLFDLKKYSKNNNFVNHTRWASMKVHGCVLCLRSALVP